MKDIIKINDNQLKYVLAQLFAEDKKAAEALVVAARKAAESEETLKGLVDGSGHGRGVAC